MKGSIKIGNIEIINLKDMGRMSLNRGRKIIKTQYGGKPWRLPSVKEMEYLTKLYNIGIGDFVSKNSISTSYWTNHAWVHGNEGFIYNIKNGSLMNSSMAAAVGYLIIVRSI
jgi:hypothetical protein